MIRTGSTLAALLLTMGTLTLTGCSASNGEAQTDVKLLSSTRGVSQALSSHFNTKEDSAPVIAWNTKDRTSVSLLTYGSGSCPLVPAKLTVTGRHAFTLTAKHYDGACTADLSPHTSVFEIPKSIDRNGDLRVTLAAPPQPSTPLKLSAAKILQD